MPNLIGTEPNQIPTNGMLGSMAYQDAASYQGYKLITTIIPTAAANVESLNLFNSAYNNYIIVVDGVVPASTDALRFRVAVAGSAASGSNYVAAPVGSSSSTTLTELNLSANVTNATGNVSAEIKLMNINDSSKAKMIQGFGIGENGSAGTFSGFALSHVFTQAAVLSGFRLYWTGGANFAATGSVRVYGY